jgi:hypothetical protein
MADSTFMLFDEFAARFARGESPDVRAYLERAGDDRDELAELIDAFLARAQPLEPDEEAVAVMRAFVGDRPPLLELRTRRGIRVDEIVRTLVKRLGIDPRKDAKVKDYYQRLEGGLLEPRGVDRSVWEALAAPLGDAVRELGAWRPRMVSKPQRAAFAREALLGRALGATVSEDAVFEDAVFEDAVFEDAVFAGVSHSELAAPAEEDEVDLLFTGANRPPAAGT